jgi:hypothetical protein
VFSTVAGYPHDHPNLAWCDPRNQERRVPQPNANRRPTRLPLDPRQKGRLRATACRGQHRTFSNDHFWESEEAIRAFAGHDISVAKYYDFDKDFLLELEPCSTHYEMYDS